MEIPNRIAGICKSLRGFRPFLEKNTAIDEYHWGEDSERSIRLEVGHWTLLGLGWRPDDQRGYGAAVIIIAWNRAIGLWRDPLATPWTSEYEAFGEDDDNALQLR